MQFGDALLVHRSSGFARDMVNDGDKLSVWVRLFGSWCIPVVVSGRYACCPGATEGGTVSVP